MIRAELAAAVAERGVDVLGRWRGPPEVKQDVLAVLHAGRNLLLEGPVGSGKTMLATAVAGALPPIRLAGCDFGCLPGELACPQCRSGLVRGEQRRADPEVQTPPSVRATLAALALACSHRALEGRRPWGEAVRGGLRLAFAGRLALSAGSVDADRVDRWLDARLAALEP